MAGTVNGEHRSPEIWLKRALLLIVIGLMIQLMTVVHITPARFLLFVGAGFGPVAVGLAMFGWAAILHRRAVETAKESLDGEQEGGRDEG